MLNLQKIIKLQLSQAFKKAFNQPLPINCHFEGTYYTSTIAEDFYYKFKEINTKMWKETLYPKDIAKEILVHFQNIQHKNYNLISNIEVNSSGHILFTINKNYYESLTLSLEPYLPPTCIIGPFITTEITMTDLRGIAISDELEFILRQLCESVDHYIIYNGNPNLKRSNLVPIKEVKSVMRDSRRNILILPAKFYNKNDPNQWCYNYTNVDNANEQYLSKDPWEPLISDQPRKDLQVNTQLIANYPSILEECLETKSLRQYWQFKQSIRESEWYDQLFLKDK